VVRRAVSRRARARLPHPQNTHAVPSSASHKSGGSIEGRGEGEKIEGSSRIQRTVRGSPPSRDAAAGPAACRSSSPLLLRAPFPSLASGKPKSLSPSSAAVLMLLAHWRVGGLVGVFVAEKMMRLLRCMTAVTVLCCTAVTQYSTGAASRLGAGGRRREARGGTC
jgi:hypothetical protein